MDRIKEIISQLLIIEPEELAAALFWIVGIICLLWYYAILRYKEPFFTDKWSVTFEQFCKTNYVKKLFGGNYITRKPTSSSKNLFSYYIVNKYDFKSNSVNTTTTKPVKSDISDKRLTTLNQYNEYVPIALCETRNNDSHCKYTCEEACIACNGNCNNCDIQSIFNKLGQLEDAIESGTLIKMGVPFGETVYLIDKDCKGCPNYFNDDTGCGCKIDEYYGKYNMINSDECCKHMRIKTDLMDYKYIPYLGQYVYADKEDAATDIQKEINAYNRSKQSNGVITENE